MTTSSRELWLATGSQHLYGPETLRQVDADSYAIVTALNAGDALPLKIVFKPCLKTSEEITALCREANNTPACVGMVCWMHTFSPAKMWIAGLKSLQKPLCHLHTQFNRDIPWASIDMDFMNLNQSAHGGREFGHICARIGQARHVIVGHWEDPEIRNDLAAWARVAAAWAEFQSLKVVRFGDNMRQVAVTDGDKVEAERVFGVSVNTHGIGDLVGVINDVSDSAVTDLCGIYADNYDLAPELAKAGERHESLRTAAKIELGLRSFLETGGFGAFTDTFEDLHGLCQLPGLPAQRLMADGYGFGAEGDWKHAALLRVMKAMNAGADAGTSFMEDYTYHFKPDGMRCLGAHMLEICPSIATKKPSCEIHPLGIGGKDDPVRLVFDGKPGPALNASLVDMGNRFRLLINEVVAYPPEQALPKLPVARVLWEVMPNLKTGAAAWIHAGGAHHTVFSYSTTTDQLLMLAEMASIEALVIDQDTNLRQFRNELRWNATSYGLKGLA
ncbi:L-arabinose isomerase [Cerasicoccus arenae]|uniref:L-arabinose isomerase n=1 Tax=Cerasicoccus arenae TaxID=424488 RepID=A0A8J3GDH1_9BACT|nr:L-arabinose isomerase [Cerasicoccus arenae]MBK1858105.1 L-arabinose isomerase [Cerasicoccus arenae]GHB96500.1 L-arabinose isomerase [Cerasicoccus arenae]